MFETLNRPVKKASPLGVIVMLIGFAVVVFWLVPAALSGDPRWFLPGVNEQPSTLSIWAGGREVRLQRGDADFAPISAAIEAAISNIISSSEFGASPSTLDLYRQTLAVEAFYDQPLQIHSRFNLGRPRQIMMPLTTSGYTEGRFMVGADGAYWAGGPRTAGGPQVRAAVEAALARRGIVPPADQP